MKLIIEIPDEVYASAKNGELNEIQSMYICGSVCNGTPLPKGHGELIDRSKIHKAIPAEEDNCTGMGMTLDEMAAYNEGIDVMYSLVQGAKPIIEADMKGCAE